MTGEDISVYPAIRRFFKMSGSFGIMLFMVRYYIGVPRRSYLVSSYSGFHLGGTKPDSK